MSEANLAGNCRPENFGTEKGTFDVMAGTHLNCMRVGNIGHPLIHIDQL
jgi:hypothetical protein